ncbi:hypothetical protein S7711_05929 [Stachybotrys chartarum IBT 7711]|uniref:lytic cellulose monooxygenase (C4-dehydrogenating) n=1 Tax=Stachybotrys chartarum (strain CBS 109288 / IBT 7711) TaxID=1280523 RepID=A0A084B1A9_STACB|nr:hypothetical protein S7711_05929 [Stachybotrys chartarum IBT 7711]KFA51582.1 hypothetical protein S40293_03902 [Stachybotrys chartarum IBT 40293]KFA81431.1 hypothetical protein S40288_07292 [Stachybotrys chartarum IBT 40288]
MKSSIISLMSLALIPGASAHYFFGRLILDGKITNTWEYVRQISPEPSIADPSTAILAPNTRIESPDLRCGRNASMLRAPVKTATVAAGDRVGFLVGEVDVPIPNLNDEYMYHPGFASAWLSKAPDGDLDAYQGDGDWFKIFSFTLPTEQSRDWTSAEWRPRRDMFRSLWGTYLLDTANFTIPATTPPGNYLLRFEHVFPNEVDAQFFVNCAQIEITNSGTVGSPAPTVKIPGVYTRGQPDVYFSTYTLALDNNFDISSFEAPAPAVWSG